MRKDSFCVSNQLNMSVNRDLELAKEELLKSFDKKLQKLGKTYGVADSDLKVNIYADLCVKYGHSVDAEDKMDDEYISDLDNCDNQSLASNSNLKRKIQNSSSGSEKRAREDTLSGNRFAPLVDNFSELDDIVKKTKKDKPAPQPGKNEQKKKHVPPIVCYNINVSDMAKALRTMESPPKYTAINVNKAKTILKPETVADQKILFNVLKKANTKAFTFTPKEEKPVTLLLKGIHGSYNTEEVREAIMAAAPETPLIKVANLETAASKRKGIKLNSFIIQVEAGTDTSELIRLRYMLHQKITWEKFRSSGMTQCRNCQCYGHVARNCSAPYRCVKCKGGHGPGECKRNVEQPGDSAEAGGSKKDPTPPFCTLCNKDGHTANYRGCPTYQRLLKQREEKRSELASRKQQAWKSVNSYVEKGKSFASLFNSNNNKTNKTNNINQTRSTSTNNPEINNFLTKECHDLFGTNMFSLLSKVKDFLPKYRSLKTKLDKQSAYLEFLVSICK